MSGEVVRVDADFNERDHRGHVRARLLGDQVSCVAPGQQVHLCDPLERLWAQATVVRVSPDTRIAAFDVDWHSFWQPQGGSPAASQPGRAPGPQQR